MSPSVFVIGETGFKTELVNHGIRVSNFDEDPYLENDGVVSPDMMDQLLQVIDPSVVGVVVGTDF